MEPAAPPCQEPTVGIGRGRRAVYLSLGWFFVGLAFLGAFLPLLPTTPFLLLASALFLKSSPALNRWLLGSRLFGPFLRDWQQHHGVRLRVKVTAVLMLVVVGGASVAYADLGWPVRAAVLVVLLIGLIVVVRLPVIRAEPVLVEEAVPAQTDTNCCRVTSNNP